MCGQQGLPFVARAAPGAVYDLREGVAGVALPLQVSPRFCLPKWAAPACTHTHDSDKGAATIGAGAAFDDVPSIPSRDASLARVPICVDARSREHGSRSRLRGLLQWELSSER